MTTTLKDQALALLEAGFHVFPLGGYGETPHENFIKDYCAGDIEVAKKQWPKHPRVSWKAFQTVAPTREWVESQWTKWPNANIGIACGALVVIDADSMESADNVRLNCTPTPIRVKTGKGMHFWFRHNPAMEVRNSTNRHAKIDVRATGGYVVGPGSQHASGAFYVLDMAEGASMGLTDLPMIQASDMAFITGYRDANIAKTGNLGIDISKIKSIADGSPVGVGGRNDAAASLAGQYIRAGHSLREIYNLMHGWNANNPEPLADSEVNTVTASVANTHLTNNPDSGIRILPAPPPTPKIKQFPPFPAHLLHVPGLIGDVMAYSQRTARQPQPVLQLCGALAFCYTLMGHKIQSNTGLRTNDYFISVAASCAGKEHMRNVMKTLFKAAGASRLVIAERLSSDNGLFAALKRQPVGMLLADELGRFLKAVMGKNAPPYLTEIASSLMQLTGAAESTFEEKQRAEHMDKEKIVIEQPNLVIYGTTVPNRLFQALSIDDVIDGLFARFMIFTSNDADPEPQSVTDKSVPEHLIEQIKAWVGRTINADVAAGNIEALIPNPYVVEATPGAALVLAAFDLTMRARKRAASDRGIDVIWGRAHAHACRMAMARAAGISFAEPMVQESDAQWACEVVDHVTSEMVFGIEASMSSNDQESAVMKVKDVIAKKGEITMRDLQRRFQNLKPAHLREIVAHLVETDQVHQEVKVNAGARPTTTLKWTGN